MTENSLTPSQNLKRLHILNAAGAMFVAQGFKSVSMDAIAEAAPVSKATLYKHFADKKALFNAVIAKRCAALAQILEQQLNLDDDPAIVLRAVGNEFLQLITSPDNINMHRIIIAEAKEFPELGKLFYQSGPLRSHQLLADYLTGLQRAKLLIIPDAVASAGLFFSALKGRHHLECLLGIQDGLTPHEQKVIVDYAVTMFLKAHAVERAI